VARRSGLRIARENLASAEGSVQLTTDRYNRGLSTELDLGQRADLRPLTTGALIPQLEQQEQRLINAIGLLVGEYPRCAAGGTRSTQGRAAGPRPWCLSALPSETGEAAPRHPPGGRRSCTPRPPVSAPPRRDFYPQVYAVRQPFDFRPCRSRISIIGAPANTAWGRASRLPIFEGGRLRATLALREGQQQEAAATYQRTVLGGVFVTVDDALTAYAAEQRRARAV